MDALQGAGIARWWCVGLANLLDAASWVRSSSGENFSGRKDFPLGVSMSSDSNPPKLFWRQNNTQHAPSTKTECEYLNGWTKNGHIPKNLTKKGENQRSSWRTQKKKTKKKKKKKKDALRGRILQPEATFHATR